MTRSNSKWPIIYVLKSVKQMNLKTKTNVHNNGFFEIFLAATEAKREKFKKKDMDGKTNT